MGLTTSKISNLPGQKSGGESPAFTNTKSLSLDGVDDNATTQHSGWGSDLTWSVWINVISSSAMTGYGAIYAGSVVPYLTTFYNGTSLKVIYGHDNGELTSNTNIDYNRWIHVLIQKSSGTVKIYIDGQLDNNTVLDSSSYAASPAVIGAFPSFVGSGFNTHGKIDELALWDRALSNSEVASIYNNGTPTDLSSLNPVNYWRFENNGTDLGSKGDNATLNNGATFSTDVP